MRCSTIFTAVLTLSLAGLISVIAPSGNASARAHAVEQATPATGFPLTPDPAECTGDARAVDAIAAILQTPWDPTGRITGQSSVTIPLGQPADAATVAAIAATVRTLAVCFTAGDFLRAFAVVTDDAIHQLQVNGVLSLDSLPFLAETPVAEPSEARATFLAITDVSILPDGRAGLFVIEDDPTAPPLGRPETDYLVCKRVGDRWLIDEFVESWFLAPPADAATPAA